DRLRGFLAFKSEDGAMPVQGALRVFVTGPDGVEQVGEVVGAKLWGRATVSDERGVNQLLIHSVDSAAGSTTPQLRRYTIEDGTLRPVSEAAKGPLAASPIRAVLRTSDEPLYVVSSADGGLAGVRWSGEAVWNLDLAGGRTPAVSAA